MIEEPVGDLPPDRPARPRVGTTWSTLSASTIGSVHVRDQLPLQDAVHTWSDQESGQAVVAVADGHGHKLHFRSDTGAALAVVSAVEEMRRLLRALADPATRDDPDGQRAVELAFQAGAALVETWVAKVHHHLEAHPYSPDEVDAGAQDDPLRAYGSTILVAGAVGDTLVFLQLGDGDSVAVSTRGEASRPLPEDPDLDGLHTTSLCQAQPLDALRCAVVDAQVEDIGLVFLCSDGFGRSRVDADGWWRQTGEQLLDFSRTKGLGWVSDQLPEWLAEPALIGGDDTTMALLVRSDLGDGLRPDLVQTVPRAD